MTDEEKIKMVPQVLAESAAHLQKLAADNSELLSENEKIAAENAALKHELRCIKVAKRMEERNLEPTLTLAEKVASLSEMNSEKLDVVEASVELVAGGFSLGGLKNNDETGEKTAGAAVADLDNFILSQQAFS